VAQFKTAVLVFLGAEYARRGWVQQYHIGALRNNSLRVSPARRRARMASSSASVASANSTTSRAWSETKLGEVSDTDIRRFADLQSALTKRLDHFAAHGCKVIEGRLLDVERFIRAPARQHLDIK
jgi:glucuronate isomerase